MSGYTVKKKKNPHSYFLANCSESSSHHSQTLMQNRAMKYKIKIQVNTSCVAPECEAIIHAAVRSGKLKLFESL